MTGSIFLDDDGYLTIEEQTGPKSFSKQKFQINQILKYEFQKPTLFSNGSIKFFLKDGNQTSKLIVPRNAKAIFQELVSILDAEVGKVSKPNNSIPTKVIRSKNSKSTKLIQNDSLEVDLNSNDWVAVDIEWADSAIKSSVCEIGLAKFHDGELVDTWRSYIKPPLEFEVGWGEFSTHGISKEILNEAPFLSDVWDEIEKFIDGHIWVLHNATQDVNRILAALDERGMSLSDFNYIDTMLISRKHTWILTASGLDDLSGFFNFKREFANYDGREDLENSHGALEDAILTGKILGAMIELTGYSNLFTFLKVLEVSFGEVRKNNVMSGFSAPGKFKYLNKSELPDESVVLKEVKKEQALNQKADAKIKDAEETLSSFLENPTWSSRKLERGNSVCFTHLMVWDDNGNNHEALVHEIANNLGIEVRFGLRNDLDLLVVNDPWIYDSAKLRNALSRKKPIDVTTYSEFIKYNTDFPEWSYLNSDQYTYMKAEGTWPTNPRD